MVVYEFHPYSGSLVVLYQNEDYDKALAKAEQIAGSIPMTGHTIYFGKYLDIGVRDQIAILRGSSITYVDE